MTTLARLSAFCLFFLALSASRAELIIQNGQKVAFLGDSITARGWEWPGGYVRLVASGLETMGVKIEAIPAGVGGNTSKDMLDRLDASVLSKKPEWMLLSCGVNDVNRGAQGGIELEDYKKNISSIVDRAIAAGIKVMILTATGIGENDTPKNQKLAGYNDFLRQLAAEKKCPLADLNTEFWNALKTNPSQALTVDGIHMGPYGNIMMAQGVLKALGATPDQVNKAKDLWMASPEAAAVITQFDVQGIGPVSLPVYEGLGRLAKERGKTVQQLQNEFLFEALRSVLKSHEKEESLKMSDIQAELHSTFGRLIESRVNP